MAYKDKENEIELNGRKLQIRNSTVDFLVFTKNVEDDGIEVRVQNQNVWLTQKAIAQLFDVDRSVVTKHLKNIFENKELSEKSTCANFAQVAENGKTYQYKYYSLPAIIAVGYRTNSVRATQFRQWATKVIAAIAKAFAESEFEQYRIIQDKLYQSDFDRLMEAVDSDEV